MKTHKVCICGVGYVGLTLATVMADKGFEVVGVEIKPDVVESLNKGEPHFHEAGLREIFRRHINRNLRIYSTVPDEIFDAYVITVGTPLKKGAKVPELEFIRKAAGEISRHLISGNLVILRSTVSIGTSRNVVLPVLQGACPDISLAFCPERTLEGKALEELKYLPQIIGGLDTESVEKAEDIFRNITPTVIKVSSLETAEMIKLLDNSYRDTSFAFANEVAEICAHAGIDAQEIIKSGKIYYPRTNIPVPGYVGGACLEKDPHILIHSMEKYGYTPKLIKQSREIHENLPADTVDRVNYLLEQCGKEPEDCKVFLTGLAFKGEPETDDLRGSPALIFIEALQKSRIGKLQVHDFVVKDNAIRALGIEPVPMKEGFRDSDAVIIANNHNGYRKLDIINLVNSMKKPAILYDSWRLFDKAMFADKKDIIYEGLGFRSSQPESNQGVVSDE